LEFSPDVVALTILTEYVLASPRASEGLLRKEEGILPSPRTGAPPGRIPGRGRRPGAGPRREGLM